MPEMPSYDATGFWPAYRARLEAAFGIALRRRALERWMTWRGHQVHLDEWEAEGGARGTVVLVHGGGGNGRLLAPFAAPLAEAGFRVVAPDLPGYGLTVPRPDWRPDYADWVDLAADLASEAADQGPAFTYGLSVGGITALWAAQRSGRVAGVVATTLISLRDRETFIGAARSRLLGRAVLFSFRFAPWIADRVALPLAFAMPLETLTTDAPLAQLFLRDPLIGRRRVASALFRSMTTYAPPRPDFALPCPLLLAHPGADTWTPTAMSRPIFDAIPGEKRFVELTNGAHAPLEAPAYQELNAAVLAFLRERSGAA